MLRIVSAGCVCTDVFVEEGKNCPGGEALNFCGNACLLPDTDCYLIGIIGTDSYGREIFKRLEDYPVSKEYVKVVEGTTANNKIYHTEQGDRYFQANSWTGGVYDSLVLTEQDLDLIKGCDVVHTTADSPVFGQILSCRQANSFLLAVDFNTYRSFDKWQTFVGEIDVFFISGSPDILDKLKEWSLLYDTVFVATLAEEGSVAYVTGKELRCKAERVPTVVDTTGAGDSFQAGFMVSYGKERNVEKALKAGSECAARNIRRLGGF